MQLRVSDYQKLKEYVAVFDAGLLDLLIIEGNAGSGKSSIVRQTLSASKKPESFCWIEGRITAAALYEKLYEYRDAPIIIDDVDGLYKNKESVNLLKCLAQTEATKSVSWNTLKAKNAANESGIPTEFKTKSKTCIITNDWKMLNKHVGAVSDRGLLILFYPSAEEIHRYVKEHLSRYANVYDDEIYNFIGANLGVIAEPSIRHYRNALQLKLAGMDWQECLIESFGLSDTEMLVLKLANDTGKSTALKAQIFATTLKKSERTYFRVKSELEQKGIKFN